MAHVKGRAGIIVILVRNRPFFLLPHEYIGLTE